jgi:uncharacterized repeat protein (TIGR03803 family)
VFGGNMTFAQLYSISSTGTVTLGLQLPQADFWGAAPPFPASDGAIWVPSTVSSHLTMFRLDPAGGVQSWPLPLTLGSLPIVEDDARRLWGADQAAFGEGLVYTVTLDGQVQVPFSLPQHASLYSIIVGADGHVYALTGPLPGRPGSSILQLDTSRSRARVVATLPLAQGPLIEASDGNFYACSSNVLYRIGKQGGVTALHTFGSGPEGTGLYGGVMQASDGLLYGLAYQGGAAGYGTVFRATLDGVVTVVHTFSGEGSAQAPSQYVGVLTQGSDGALYGHTSSPFANSPGENTGATTFRLDLGLPLPAPQLLRSSAMRVHAGDTVLLTGRNLLATSAVSVGGVPASFVQRSSQYVELTVPAGTRGGHVAVSTPNGTAASPFVLRVD